MGAYVREFGKSYARFIAVWTMGLGYGGATLFNQAYQFSSQPLTSTIWILVIALVSFGTYKLLQREGVKQQQLAEQLA
jgi:ferrous iron transport protein B